MDACLQALRLEETFMATVSGADVQHGKPAPDIFLKAAGIMGIAPHQCLVFEDAPAGIAAAHAAGMRVLALATSHSLDEIAAADSIAPNFAPLRPDAVQAGWRPL